MFRYFSFLFGFFFIVSSSILAQKSLPVFIPSDISGNSFTARWDNLYDGISTNVDNATGVDEFRITVIEGRDPYSGTTLLDDNVVGNRLKDEYFVDGLVSNTVYYYRVSAYSVANNLLYISDYIKVLTSPVSTTGVFRIPDNLEELGSRYPSRDYEGSIDNYWQSGRNLGIDGDNANASVGDINGDGYNDIIESRFYDSDNDGDAGLVVYFGSSDGSFSERVIWGGGSHDNFSGLDEDLNVPLIPLMML